MQRFVDRLHPPQQQLFQQVYRQQFGIAPRPLPGIDDLAEQLAKARLPLFIRTEKAGLGKNRWPVEPLVPVGARAEVDPLVIPLAGVGMAAIVMNFPGGNSSISPGRQTNCSPWLLITPSPRIVRLRI